MTETVQLTASDGHTLDAYIASPDGEPVGGLVVIQEVFGVNRHIRSVAEGYARDSFLVVAPALFDRVERKVELGYEGEDMQRAMQLARKLDRSTALLDVEAALAYAGKAAGKAAGVIGYCYGGMMAWLSATRLRTAAAVGYYAGGIGEFAEETPKAPVMLHFGRQDTHIPKEQVDLVANANPEVQIFWYDAGHGFNCDLRASYEPEAAKLARERSLAFLKRHVAGQ